MKNKILILLVLTISLFACRKEKIVTEYITKDDHSWNPYDEVDMYGTYGLGVSVYNNALYIITGENMIYHDGNSYKGYQSNNYQFNSKPSIHEAKMLQISNSQRMLYFNYDNYSHGFIIDTSKIENFLSYRWNIARPYSAINDKNNQCFAFYNSSAPQPNDSICFNFFMFQPSVGSVAGLTNYITSNINLPKKPYSIHSVCAHFGNYFMATSDGIMLIDTNANIKTVLVTDLGNEVWSIFKNKNTLFAMSTYFIYRSDDFGMTWIKSFAIPHPLNQYLFTDIDGEIFGHLEDQVILMNITSDSLEITKIYNKGLKNRYITGIAKYNSNMIITTTAGTYKKPYIDLFYKE